MRSPWPARRRCRRGSGSDTSRRSPGRRNRGHHTKRKKSYAKENRRLWRCQVEACFNWTVQVNPGDRAVVSRKAPEPQAIRRYAQAALGVACAGRVTPTARNSRRARVAEGRHRLNYRLSHHPPVHSQLPRYPTDRSHPKLLLPPILLVQLHFGSPVQLPPPSPVSFQTEQTVPSGGRAKSRFRKGPIQSTEIRRVPSALGTCYLRIPLRNSSTYGKLLSRISSNVVPTCVVSRLRSKHSKTARR